MARASDEAGGLVMARRGRRLCEKIAGSLTAFVEVNLTQHLGNRWTQVNNKIKHSGMVTNIAILNDSTRYQDLPGNADPEEEPRFSRGRASGH
jgi:hypothetical protein